MQLKILNIAFGLKIFIEVMLEENIQPLQVPDKKRSTIRSYITVSYEDNSSIILKSTKSIHILLSDNCQYADDLVLADLP